MKQVENVQSVFYFRQVSDRIEKKEKIYAALTDMLCLFLFFGRDRRRTDFYVWNSVFQSCPCIVEFGSFPGVFLLLLHGKEKTENRNRNLAWSVASCLPDTGNLVGKWKQSDFESGCGYHWQAVSLCISSL